MKIQRIRGQKRRAKQIQRWISSNLSLNKQLLKEYNRDYCEIIVHPWCDISLIKSMWPEPRGKNRIAIVSGLIDIYEAWKLELDSLGINYYLKIWLFEPYLSKSQVVCAIDEKLNFYDEPFYKIAATKELQANNYGSLAAKIKKFNWEQFQHEMTLESDYLGEAKDYLNERSYVESKKWYHRIMKKPHRTFKMIVDGEERTFDAFPKGTVWVGGHKQTPTE